MQETIINRVANSGLVSLDLTDFYHPAERIIYDLKDNLFMGLILKEKDFRDFLKSHDFEIYAGKNVAIICSADAVIPTWAYMLLAVHIEAYAHIVVIGDINILEHRLYELSFANMDFTKYKDARVVVKGCGDVYIPNSVYFEISKKLKPYVRSLMFGEPCSTVPIYKSKNNA